MAVSNPDDLLLELSEADRHRVQHGSSDHGRSPDPRRLPNVGHQEPLLVRGDAGGQDSERHLALPAGDLTLSGLGALPPVVLPELHSGVADREVRLVAGSTAKLEPRLAARIRVEGGVTVVRLFVPPGFDGGLDLVGERVRLHLPLVHPVPRPLAPPELVGTIEIGAEQGNSRVTGAASYLTHHASTGRLHLVASWRERVDPDGFGSRPDRQRAMIGAADIDPQASGPVRIAIDHDFGDTRHRLLSCRGVASSRFAAYYPDARSAELDSAAEPVIVSVPNRAVPPPPRTRSVVPIVTPHSVCLRVQLEAPWDRSGIGERLGVVVAQPHTDGSSERGIDRALRCFPAAIGPETAELTILDRPSGGAAVVASHVVQLDVVRYQPESVSGCHVSAVVRTETVDLRPWARTGSKRPSHENAEPF